MTGERDSTSAWRTAATFVVIAIIALVVAHTLDRFAWEYLRGVERSRSDGYRLLRALGYWPTWGLIGAVLLVLDWRRGSGPRIGVGLPARGFAVLCATGAAGLASEALKLLIRRERPTLAMEYVFRPFWEEPFRTSGLGLPSGHTVIAFAGAFTLSRLYPELKWLWLALAAGCAYTRLMDGAHYLSDTTLGVLVAWAVTRLIWTALVPGDHSQPPAGAAA